MNLKVISPACTREGFYLRYHLDSIIIDGFIVVSMCNTKIFELTFCVIFRYRANQMNVNPARAGPFLETDIIV